jgi:ankyrin repeat protein
VVIDAQTEENGTTPLQFAAFEGRLETARLLINAYRERDKIKEIDARDHENTSTLQYAALGIQEDMNREVAELLVEKGADPYQLMDGDVSLMDIAAVVGNSAMVEYCLEKTHDREDEASVIRSAIRLARSEGCANIVIILQSRYEML